ncbi:MAG TPA: circularly permuted type 2 ATP-grasp protein [Xanthobacteraceae bacterium]|nr:circularly permuted type 2 ATP-grasp protein [Xanthobacteraceae bacterium]
MAAQRDSATEQNDREQVEPLLSGYRPLPGIFDEMVDRDGRARPHWRPFLGMLAALGPQELNRRFAAADRHLHDSGVFYRVYEDPAGAERPWPLSHVPLLISAPEWQVLEAGLIQRAQLLEAVLADAYGPANLVREGRLPAAVVAGNPEFLRPLVGVAPPGGAHLRFYAVDVGRSPDGDWWVLGDRTQAPSGAGYALENRIAISRAMPDIYRELKVERFAPFFQAFQAELSSLNRQDDSRVCVLTPGPMNETYFEHAYLARYLGFLLVEGEDLTVRDDGVFIRTVSGLKRAEVLLRRLDADFADPLELNARSRLGVPGLVQAVRDGTVVIANALGSGVVEARALLSFLPALAPAVLGRELALPNVATWWLGQGKAREEIIDRLDDMVIASAYLGELPGHGDRREVLGATLEPEERARILGQIAHRGIDFVAKEAVRLSTTPVWHNGGLEPRPFTLRLFLARVGGGWRVMPGGFVRVADDADSRAVSLQRGGSTGDAWVLSDKPVAETTLLPAPDRITITRAIGALPSRAAANLFWLARYVERAEATLRLVRALVNRAGDSDEATTLVVKQICSLLAAWDAVPTDLPNIKPVLAASAALQRHDLTGALPYLVGAAQSAASVIRDRFSPDAWRALTDLNELVNAPIDQAPAESAMFERTNAALRIIASFSGLAQENMSQATGWRFLELGRRIERAIATCRFVRQFAFADELSAALDVLLELADSQITYRLRYVMVAAPAPVVDLVVLDPNNPRSVAYQLARIEAHLAALPKRSDDGRLSPPEQIATALATRIRTADAAALDEATFVAMEASLMKLADVIAATYFTTHERAEVRWEALG